MTQNLINWAVKTDIAVIISFFGLLLAIWQFHKQQQQQQQQEIRLREKEFKEAVKQRQQLKQQLKLQAQQLKFQGEQISQLLDWMSQFTFSNYNRKD